MIKLIMKEILNVALIASNLMLEDEAKEFYDSLLEKYKTNGVIKNWIKSELYEHLASIEEASKITKVKETDPSWVKDKYKKEDIFRVTRVSNQLKTDVENILDYLLATRRNAKGLAFSTALKEAIEYRKDLEQKISVELGEKALEGEIVVRTYKDGFSWKMLTTKEALIVEGRRMKHCVGDELQGYITKVLRDEIKIFSLRDKKNIPHCTIEYVNKEHKIEQIKGNSNGPIKQEYVIHCKNFIEKPIKLDGKKLKIEEIEDLKNVGIIEQEGKWYSIYHLPKNFTVENNLELSRTTITKLPEGLKVRGNLNLSNCTSFTELPKGLEVRSLHLNSCTSLTELPEGLKIKGNLNLYNCTSITELPKDLKVEGDLSISNCTSLTELPEGLKIKGNLDLYNCTSITELPKGLEIRSLHLNSCTSLTELPKGLEIRSLHLNSCTSLTELPKDLKVKGNLDLRNCTSLTELPKDLKVEGDLSISNCTSLTELPKGLEVRSLHLNSCTSLTELPKDLKVKGNLRISNCTSLTELPKDLKVEGDLDLRNSEILSLPRKLKVNIIRITSIFPTEKYPQYKFSY